MPNDPDILIRQLTAADLAEAEALARILIAAWRSGFRGILPDSIIELYTQPDPCAQMFRQILESGAGTMYLCAFQGQPSGLLYRLSEDGTHRIEALLTVPEVWGKGVGPALLKQALEDAGHAVTVWPFAENHRARRFYEKHGFSPTGRTRMGDAEEVEYIRIAAQPRIAAAACGPVRKPL